MVTIDKKRTKPLITEEQACIKKDKCLIVISATLFGGLHLESIQGFKLGVQSLNENRGKLVLLHNRSGEEYIPTEVKDAIRKKVTLKLVDYVNLECRHYKTGTLELYTITLKDGTKMFFINPVLNCNYYTKKEMETLLSTVSRYTRVVRYK